MGEITYGYEHLTNIIDEFKTALAKIETFQGGLEGRFDAIKTHWQEEEDKIAERDKNFADISRELGSIHDEFKQIIDLLESKNESFHNVGY